MRLDSNYKIEHIARDADRKTLQHVMIDTWQGEPVAVAADGFGMAVVPVRMEEDDVPGPFHHSLISWAREMVRTDFDVSLKLEDGLVRFDDGWTAPRCSDFEEPFPKWQRLTDGIFDGPVARESFGIQPALLYKLGEAMGVPFVTITHTSNENVVVVTHRAPNRKLEPPFGILMLAHVSR